MKSSYCAEWWSHQPCAAPLPSPSWIVCSSAAFSWRFHLIPSSAPHQEPPQPSRPCICPRGLENKDNFQNKIRCVSILGEKVRKYYKTMRLLDWFATHRTHVSRLLQWNPRSLRRPCGFDHHTSVHWNRQATGLQLVHRDRRLDEQHENSTIVYS